MNSLRQTEQAILAQGREWTRCRLQAQLQQEADTLPAVCRQTGQALTGTMQKNASFLGWEQGSCAQRSNCMAVG